VNIKILVKLLVRKPPGLPDLFLRPWERSKLPAGPVCKDMMHFVLKIAPVVTSGCELTEWGRIEVQPPSYVGIPPCWTLWGHKCGPNYQHQLPRRSIPPFFFPPKLYHQHITFMFYNIPHQNHFPGPKYTKPLFGSHAPPGAAKGAYGAPLPHTSIHLEFYLRRLGPDHLKCSVRTDSNFVHVVTYSAFSFVCVCMYYVVTLDVIPVIPFPLLCFMST